MEEAVRLVDQWLEQPNVGFLAVEELHWNLLRPLLVEGQTRVVPWSPMRSWRPLSVEYGGVRHSTDRDSARFPGLRCTNPLE
jgi:hypothetical protein